MKIRVLADNLRRIRKAGGLSQDELAAKSGVSRGVIQLIESEETNPTLSSIEALAGCLKCSIEDLLREPVTKPNPPKKAPRALEELQVIEFLKAFSALDQRQRWLVQAIVHNDPAFAKHLTPADLPRFLTQLSKARSG